MNSSKAKKNESTVMLDESILDPKNHKVRITTMLDGDVLHWLKEQSSLEGLGYQTYLNVLLRKLMSGGTLEDRVRNLEKIFLAEESASELTTEQKLLRAIFGRDYGKGSTKPRAKSKKTERLPIPHKAGRAATGKRTAR